MIYLYGGVYQYAEIVQQYIMAEPDKSLVQLTGTTVLEINFFLWVASTCYLEFKVVAKLTYLVAIIGGHVIARLPPVVRFMTKHNSIYGQRH